MTAGSTSAPAPVPSPAPAGPAPVRRRHPIAAFLLSPVDPATWRAVFAIGMGFVVSIVAISLVSMLFSMGGSLLILVVGFAIVALGIEAARMVAKVERWRMLVVDGSRPLIPHPYKLVDPIPAEPYGTWLRKVADAVFLDTSRWLDVAYVLVSFPLAMIEFVVAVVLWSISVAFLVTPLALLVPRRLVTGIDTLPVAPESVIAVLFVIGLALLPVAASATRGMAILHRYVVEGLLCISPADALRRDNERLRGSRAATIELEASELRRIERDLHDGAQQRLVMLAIDLSLAEDKVDTDPAAARALIAGARDQARQALGELREVVRGAAPAILLDRGLAAALSAVAGRSTVPTYVDSGLAPNERLPHGVERAAYYVVTEALTNVAKHADARRCDVALRRAPGWLLVEIRDDGVGGAGLEPGGGLAGLRDRVEALDGRLDLSSPPGGPTVLRVWLPTAGA